MSQTSKHEVINMLIIKTFMKWFDHEVGLNKFSHRFDLNLKTSDLNLDSGDLD